MSVPIPTSPGRSGFGPELSLVYDSGSGNGPFGFGWNLNVPTITRKTDKGLPRYQDADESDVYVLSGTEDLVPVLEPDGTRLRDTTTFPGYVIDRYRPRIEGLFARIERWTKVDTGEIHWRSISRDNVTSLYGTSNHSRVFDPADPSPDHPKRIFRWLICESHDDKGNAIVYEYAAENDVNVDLGQASERNRVRTANRYLKRVLYGNRVSCLIEPDLTRAEWMFELVFDYDQGHYEPLAPDPARPVAEQLSAVRASAVPARPWAVRPDPFSTYRAGYEVRTYRRCRRLLMFHHIPGLPTGEKGYDGLVRCTEFDYADLDYEQPVTADDEATHQGSTRLGSFLRAVTQSGYVRDETRPAVDENGVQYTAYVKKSLPRLEFEYSRPVIRDEVLELDEASLENLPAGVDGTTYQWVDLDGEGVPGILTEQTKGWFYKRNLGGARFGALEHVGAIPSLSALGSGGQQLLDLAGDGQLDLVALSGPTPGFYERGTDGTWAPFRSFRQVLDIAWDDPNLRFVDLDGDGHTDVLIGERDVFTWHASLAEEGFGPAQTVRQAQDEERGPGLVFADGTQAIHVADMSGDGLADLVRIRDGDVSYWPNLGHGRFGPKVTMDNAPRLDPADGFDPGRVRLADIDGSGTNDLIHLAADGVRLYFNQSGNCFGQARRLVGFPHVDDLSSVMTADLLGNGTACLVWSSGLPADAHRPMRYVDLMGATKPHLLIRSVNNLGAETEIHYAPSTRAYLADKHDGRPWVTRLPFPVHVVDRVVTDDRISGNRFVSRYAYHHGYFDGVEREFRGFGMVEQWDTEEFAAFDAEHEAPLVTNLDAASHVPPTLTRTWFHTGVYVRRDHVSDFFAGLLGAGDVGEYYREPGLNDTQARALLLDDAGLPGGLTVDEQREACRALKGSMLRQEVYALDGTGTAMHPHGHPFAVTEQNFAVRMLQRRGANQHAVFLTHPSEALLYHYERDPADPRLGHTLTLEVDDYGNVKKSATVAYGRRQPDLSLPALDQAEQRRILITYAENGFTNAVESGGCHRTPLLCEACTYELTGMTPDPGRGRFTPEELLGAATSAAALSYEQAPAPGRIERRLIEHVRTYFRADTLAGPLPLGGLESLALPFESYTLALTAGLVEQAYGGRAGEAMLEAEARYAHTEGDADWWVPSGRSFYAPDAAATPPQELAYAREHFFLACRYRDPFHTAAASTESVVTYDPHDLQIEETRDAVGNRVTVGERGVDPAQPPARRTHDYRVLQPALIMDANRNCSAVAFDALGMVAGTAVMGKPAPAAVEGDSLAEFRADLTQAEIDGLFADPAGSPAAALLGGATTRIVYDLAAYTQAPAAAARPAVAATIARQTHLSDLPAGEAALLQISLAYSDGFGRVVQHKTQARPGPVPRRDEEGRVLVGADGVPEMTATTVSPRWVGSGWTVFNNKGKPVREYEPFFTDTPAYEFDVRIGVSPVLFYDPAERVIATLHPDHTWEKVAFSAWRQETWDVNDTVLVADPATDADVGDSFKRLPDAVYLPTWYTLRTDPAHGTSDAERRAAEKASVHAATPTVAHADPLGRAFLTVTRNTSKYSDTPAAEPPVETSLRARVVLDIEGNQREVIDARGRVVMRHAYDLLGNRIHQAGMESGARWMLGDVAGKPLYSWDSRDHRFRTAYDGLRRPTDLLLQEGASDELVVGRTVYGERPDAETHNLRGRVLETFDQAGCVTTDDYDFKGNLRRSRRRLSQSYKTTLDWSGAVPLEPETYVSVTRHDAFNRPTQVVAPHSDLPQTGVNVIQFGYDESGLLRQVDAWLDQDAEPTGHLDPTTASLHAATDIDHDAKGRRTLVAYGNGARTTYRYDPLTLRLAGLLTRRDGGAFPGDCPQPPPEGWPGCRLQNLHYTYDAAGNVAHVRDDAQQTIFFRNKRVEPSAEYTYDAVHRLIEATGREHLGQLGAPPAPHSYGDASRVGLLSADAAGRFAPNDGNAMGRYLERYLYDAAGNLASMQHRGTDPSAPGWSRAYTLAEPSQLEPSTSSNRLTSTAIGATTETYSTLGDGYDEHGNSLRMPHLQVVQWDFRDQLQMIQRQAVNGAGPNGGVPHAERTWYVYDSAGRRVRKVTELASGQIKSERVYLDGFELFRSRAGTALRSETLHLMDDQQRIALVETRTREDDPAGPQRLVRFQLGNHLGSAVLELDDQTQIISYEEYAPYGSTSYQAVRSRTEAPKRYRHAARERDEESGFSLHGARYYAPWLGRWTSCDPSGLEAGPNLYEFVRGNPLRFTDDLGHQHRPPPLQCDFERGGCPPVPDVAPRAVPPHKRPETCDANNLLYRWQDTPPAAPATYAPSLGVPRATVELYNRAFTGKAGERFRKEIDAAAARYDVDPGLLATNALTEHSNASIYLRRGPVEDIKVGFLFLGSYLPDIKKRVPAASEIHFLPRKRNEAADEVARGLGPGSPSEHVEFASGRDALLAHAAFLKYIELRLLEAEPRFQALPVETRFALQRRAFGSLPRAIQELHRAVRGQDVLDRMTSKERPRVPEPAAQLEAQIGKAPVWARVKVPMMRWATIHAAQAIHLTQRWFKTVLTP